MMKTLLMIVATIIGITVVAWLLGAESLVAGNWSGQVSEANEVIKPWRTLLMMCRWALWCLLWWRWEYLGERLFNREADIATIQRAQWTKMRSRMMGGIAVVEAIILFSTMRENQVWA